MRTLLVFALYYAGRVAYLPLNTDILNAENRVAESVHGFFFKIYQWCMAKSLDLDTESVCWKKPSEG